MSEGTKFDTEKNRVDLVDPEFIEEVGRVMTFGAKKYADNNWRGGIKYSRVIGATLRHIYAFARGEDSDPETGLSHMAHAACDVMFLFSYNKYDRKELDDRWVGGNPPKEWAKT